jgi:hypothetical protein
MGVFNRSKRWMGRHGLSLVGAVIVAGATWQFVRPGPATADPTVTELKKAASARVGLHQRLKAMRDLRALDTSASREALAELAAHKDLAVAAAACAQLGTLESSAAKDALKTVFEDGGRDAQVRKAAAASLALHWHTENDLDYLAEEAEGDAALSSFVTTLRARVGEEE